MIFIINVIIVFVSIIHLYTFYLQSFVWKTKGKKVFKKYPDSYFEVSEKLAFNQGIYNAFLAAGLLWTFLYLVINGLLISLYFSFICSCSRDFR
ncbi:DUF1304 family protein [Tenacibaculum vairaonense]|uniref:DUF1304 family protein n=1 Tax=Tenacibaculum vairaonense TaxID=3137860 RepID=UPI00399D603E